MNKTVLILVFVLLLVIASAVLGIYFSRGDKVELDEENAEIIIDYSDGGIGSTSIYKFTIDKEYNVIRYKKTTGSALDAKTEETTVKLELNDSVKEELKEVMARLEKEAVEAIYTDDEKSKNALMSFFVQFKGGRSVVCEYGSEEYNNLKYILIHGTSPDKSMNDSTTGRGMHVVPTMLDKVQADTIWCGTFQLVWNEMKNEVVKKDIEFEPQIEMAENLNKEGFTANMISDSYYYKNYGLKTLELKAEIEKGIKDKFDETSDILEDFDWSEEALDDPNNPNERRYFFYAMLRRSFEFLTEFDELENGKFGNKYNDVEYFGINANSDKKLGSQIDVLYYNSQNDFAVILNTKQNDEVIICKSPKGDNFQEMYEKILEDAETYMGDKGFKNIDEFKMPNLKLNQKRDYEEISNKEFATNDPTYPRAKIVKAVQTIQFELNKKGGEIKSEAGIDMVMRNSVAIENQPQPRLFYIDDTFTIFLREKGKEMPYFAGKISDITKFQ